VLASPALTPTEGQLPLHDSVVLGKELQCTLVLPL
jgi:hypothetical protein